MSTSLACPYCGHSPPPNRARLGVAIHCERCQKIYSPNASSTAAPGNPFAPASSGKPFESLVAPELAVPAVDGPSSMATFLTIFLIVGVMVLLCGGIGGYIAIKARERIVAKVKEVEEIQRQRQAELEPKPPPKPVRKKVTPQSREVRPPDFTPPLIPPPPVIPPVKKPQPNTTAEPAPKKTRPSRPPATMKSLDELLAELNDPTSPRPAWSTLQELSRLPVQENRQAEVAPALNRHLQSADNPTATAAAKAATLWGTEQNADALLALIDSPQALLRWDAMRALAKVRPTAETAELLLAQAHEVSNGSALRDALKELGPVGEETLLAALAAGDRREKQNLLRLLAETGGQGAIPALEKLIQSESDFAIKSQAEHALRRIQSRHP